ncbi:MAG: hydrogenase maturation nickel metallochaperone HypA [Gammaproteobacteria bacterium]|nr:hydrogenase maturation nickel metallochaperone HypA [Gammaproteobacteria bacterium]
MHEISVLENLREIIEAQAQEQHFSNVARVTLAIGKLSCVDPEALRFGFAAVMKDTVAERAELIIMEIPALGFCGQCKGQTTMELLYDPCAYCGAPLTEIVQGRDLRIVDLLVS